MYMSKSFTLLPITFDSVNEILNAITHATKKNGAGSLGKTEFLRHKDSKGTAIPGQALRVPGG
jgi:hypothetical protein